MGKRTVTTTILECDFCGYYQNEKAFVGNMRWYFVDTYALWYREVFNASGIPDEFPHRLICGDCLSKLIPFLEKLSIPFQIRRESSTW